MDRRTSRAVKEWSGRVNIGDIFGVGSGVNSSNADDDDNSVVEFVRNMMQTREVLE